MNSRERIRAVIAGEETDRCGFWLGNPHPDTWPILHRYFGTASDEQLRRKLNDDFRWIDPVSAYRHPMGKPVFDVRRKGSELGAGGVFSDCKDIQQVQDFPWPNPDYLDFAEIIEKLNTAGEVYRASGFWCPFFHDVAEFLGMENYFLKMYTHPEIVHAITRHVVEFYLEGNRRLFDLVGDLIEGFFFGNDFGTQSDLLIGPEILEEFVFPYVSQLIGLAKLYNYQIILHSCGSIFKIIPKLIDLGVDAIHPIQSKAADMDAQNLAKYFKGRIAFIGGIDTQEVLIHCTPRQIKEEVRRVKNLLGPRFIVSPSHEAILPDIPPQNIEAMAMTVLED